MDFVIPCARFAEDPSLGGYANAGPRLQVSVRTPANKKARCVIWRECLQSTGLDATMLVRGNYRDPIQRKAHRDFLRWEERGGDSRENLSLIFGDLKSLFPLAHSFSCYVGSCGRLCLHSRSQGKLAVMIVFRFRSEPNSCSAENLTGSEMMQG